MRTNKALISFEKLASRARLALADRYLSVVQGRLADQTITVSPALPCAHQLPRVSQPQGNTRPSTLRADKFSKPMRVILAMKVSQQKLSVTWMSTNGRKGTAGAVSQGDSIIPPNTRPYLSASSCTFGFATMKERVDWCHSICKTNDPEINFIPLQSLHLQKVKQGGHAS